MAEPLRITVWNEFRHEQQDETVAQLYPDGIHGAIASHLGGAPDLQARTASLDEPEHGLTEEVLDATDVLVWWGHVAHGEVSDPVAERVVWRVIEGMGFIALHSALHAKPFRRLMGTPCQIKWREAGEKERLWVVDTGHPIVQGLGEHIEIPQAEMYGEPCDLPTPGELVFLSWFAGGEVFRSGCCWRRGKGRVFYFRPGHESYPIFHHTGVLTVIANACRWAAPRHGPDAIVGNVKPLEDIPQE
jgi:trehalose utilization protein